MRPKAQDSPSKEVVDGFDIPGKYIFCIPRCCRIDALNDISFNNHHSIQWTWKFLPEAFSSFCFVKDQLGGTISILVFRYVVKISLNSLH